MTLHDQNFKNGKKFTWMFLGLVVLTSLAFAGAMYWSYQTRPDVEIEEEKK